MAGTIWTLGHWTSPVDAVLATLRSVEIDELVDVRKLPGSRRSPQFDAEEMTRWLGGAGIGYRRSAELTGCTSSPRWARMSTGSSRPRSASTSATGTACGMSRNASAMPGRRNTSVC